MLVQKSNLDEALAILAEAPSEIWSIDLETFQPFEWFHECSEKTKPLNRLDSKIASLQLSTPSGIEMYFNFAHKDGDIEYSALPAILDLNKSKEWIAHNFSFEWTLLKLHGYEVKGKLYDTMVMGVLYNENLPQGLKPSVKRFFSHEMPSYADTVGEGTMADITGAEGYDYGMSDTIWTLKLFDFYKERINMAYYEIFEMDIPAVASKLYMSGQSIDYDLLAQLRAEDFGEAQKIRSQYPELAAINTASPTQVANLLFNELKLPVVKVGKSSKPSTDKETLNALIEDFGDEYPLLQAFGNIRAVETREKLYYKAYPQLRYPDGRIHSELRQTGTVTGRFSMGSPNLQQVSKRGEGVKVRKVFVPFAERNEDIIVSVDWSQVELRMAAHLSQDPKLLDAYRTGKDLHTVSGTNILSCSFDEMLARIRAGDPEAKKARQKGKTLNFAALYGASAKRLAKFDLLDCSPAEAEAFLMAHKAGYSGYFYDYWNECVQFATKNLYIKTLFGRVRRLPDLQSPIKAIRAQATNKVVNSVVQGSCSELMKLAMVTLDNENLLYNEGISFIGPIHDEFVFSMNSKVAGNYIPKIVEIMERTPKGFSVPLEASVSVGLNFADQVELADYNGSYELALAKAFEGYQSKGN